MTYYVNEYINDVGRTLMAFSNLKNAQNYYYELCAQNGYNLEHYISIDTFCCANFQTTH
jgi:hypothetical protein